MSRSLRRLSSCAALRRLAGASLTAILALSVAAGSRATAQAVARDSGLHGVLAVRGERTLAAESADRLFVPASVQKLLVAVAALELLGPEHRIETAAGARVAPRALGDDGLVLPGDLVVVGSGDPSWSTAYYEEGAREPLQELARQVAAAGIRRVAGDLVVDASRFPGRRIPIDWPARDAALAWGAAPSAFAVDGNVVAVRVAPGKSLGAPARIEGDPLIEWTDQTVTVSAARDGRGTLAFQPVWGTLRIVVRGEYPISERPFRVHVASPDPDRVAAMRLLEALREAGVEVGGSVRVERFAPQAIERRLAVVRSPPLADLLVPMLEDSDNFVAESLLRVVALAETGEGRDEHGIEALERLLSDTVGLSESDFVLRDASGLSAHDLVTPRAVVELLRWAWSRPWREALAQALPAPGEGTLRSWGRLPPMVAKSGTLQGTQTLAGVLDPGDASPVFFAVLLNHHPGSPQELKREIRDRLWSWARDSATTPATQPRR